MFYINSAKEKENKKNFVALIFCRSRNQELKKKRAILCGDTTLLELRLELKGITVILED